MKLAMERWSKPCLGCIEISMFSGADEMTAGYCVYSVNSLHYAWVIGSPWHLAPR